jgi:hypothetical protein
LRNSKLLREYQARLVTDVRRAPADVLVEQPTGSGKTMQIVTLVAMHVGERFSHALIAAPQEQIEHGFVHRDYQRVDWPRAAGVAIAGIEVPEDIIVAARATDRGSVKHIRSYLKRSDPPGYALTCTHAALNRLTAADLPEDLTGKALFVDEAHHASADSLSGIVSLWRDRGGRLYFFTATPYRGDDRPVALDGMKVFRRSLAEHMAEGFAPAHLESEIVALGRPGDVITPAQFSGEEAPPASYFDALVAAVCRRWTDDGRPKAIVRVPPMQGGSSGLVTRLILALTDAGARVLDATGTRLTDKQRFLSALESEKARSYIDSEFDVMVGIQRVVEGTDWPVCSAVYCLGLPGSLTTVVQMLGRAMRSKGDNYPAAHRDTVRLVFFVPCAGGSALADLSFAHSRHALLTCCFLADHEVGQEWIVLREVRRGIKAALGRPAENEAAADAENAADEPLDPEVRAEVELVMANAREQIISAGGIPTVGEVVQLAEKSRPDLPEPALHRVAAEVLAAQPNASGVAVREAIQQAIARRLRIDPQVKQAMAEAFAVVLDEFRDVTLKDSAVLESVGRQVHGVTGGQMLELARRLREAASRPLTEEQILAWADEHRRRTGDWPGPLAGAVADALDEDWRNLDQALRYGCRSLPGDSSLSELLHEQRGVPYPCNSEPFDEERILTWADAHYRRTGRWPQVTSGPIEEAPGETWEKVGSALRFGMRGLPGKSSLAKLLNQARKVRHRSDPGLLTLEQIRAWISCYHQRTGKWPGQKSGPNDEAPGETWKAIDLALSRGRRGLSGLSSLACVIKELRGNGEAGG